MPDESPTSPGQEPLYIWDVSPTIMVVEDHPHVRKLVCRYLDRAGYSVLSTSSGAEALGWVEQSAADLAVLDLGLPDVPGEDILTAARTRRIPVVVLSGRAAKQDRISGLQQGADDYVTKPFSPEELVLRVGAVLRRGGVASTPARESFGGGRLVLDHNLHEASVDGIRITPTPTEWRLLTALAGVPRRVYSRQELTSRTHGYDFGGEERTVDSHIRNLRRRLGGGAALVETVQGFGYRLALGRDP